jgi:hypothetical protein
MNSGSLLVACGQPVTAYGIDGVGPSWLANVNERRHTPVNALAVMGLVHRRGQRRRRADHPRPGPRAAGAAAGGVAGFRGDSRAL